MLPFISAGKRTFCRPIPSGYSAGAEASTQAMSHVFEEERTDGILLIDSANAFNQMNRAVATHNLPTTCNKMSMYIINTYKSSFRLIICGGGETLSQEGTTQGSSSSMSWFSVNTAIMIQSLKLNIQEIKEVWRAEVFGRGRKEIWLSSKWSKVLADSENARPG